MSSKYILLCALSGAVWSAPAWGFGHEAMPHAIWGGIIASPLIGIAAGFAYLPAYRLSSVKRCMSALGTLYLALVLFGLTAGVFDAARGAVPSRLIGQWLLIPALGVTFTGQVLLLWPLAYFNHWLLRNVQAAS